MEPVYVVSQSGKKLMPTRKFGFVRHALKEGRARIFCRKPFTIQLLYDSQEYTQPLEIALKSGYVNVGLSLKTQKKELFSAQYTLLTDEKARHDAQRNYRRTRRNRLRYREARFLNRNKPEGWIAPSLQHKVDAQIRIVRGICDVAPITRVCVEVGVFDPALLSAMQTTGKPPVGIEYQHGPLYYYDNLRSAVFQRDGYTCRICKKSALKDRVPLHVHHALYWKKRHADTLHECITVCSDCHTSENHTPGGKLWGLEPKVPRLEGATFMNIVRWRLVNALREQLPGVGVSYTYGAKTSRIRKDFKLEKSLANDAWCIGDFHPEERTASVCFKKVRRNDRRLESFFDAKYVDSRDGRVKSGSVLGSNRTNRREPRDSEKNCRMFRREKKASGHRNICKKRPSVHVGDIAVYQGKRYVILGSSTQERILKDGTIKTSCSVLLLTKENSPTGKALKPSLKKIHIRKHCDGWIMIQ